MSGHQGQSDKAYFLLRRLHSLTGIVPIGVFLVVHLITNSTVLWGGFNSRASEHADTFWGRAVATFQHEVAFINELPLLLLIELTLWGSIAFHSILGLYYAMSGRANIRRYPHMDNWRYSLQRWTGYFGIFFIFYHVATLRWGWAFLVPGGAEWSHHYASSTLAAALQGSTEGMTVAGFLVSLFYFIGITALVYHFANGLWTAAITWGVTITRPAQKRWGYVCTALGVGLMLAAWGSLFGFATLDYHDAKRVEEAIHADVPAFDVYEDGLQAARED